MGSIGGDINNGGSGGSGGPSAPSAGTLPAIQPYSSYTSDVSGSLFPLLFTGGGGNASPSEWGMGVVALLASDKVWQLRYNLPQVVPQGTMKLRLIAQAAATANSAKVTVSDAVVAMGSDPSAATLTGETQTTVTWAGGESGVYKEAKVTLTPSPSAGGILVVALTFNTTNWTLAVNSKWNATLIFE